MKNNNKSKQKTKQNNHSTSSGAGNKTSDATIQASSQPQYQQSSHRQVIDQNIASSAGSTSTAPPLPANASSLLASSINNGKPQQQVQQQPQTSQSIQQRYGIQTLYKDSKEELFHIKTARTFFCLQNMGSECRVYMLKSYKNPRAPRKRARYERTVFEGIFQALSANQGELMLSATEEKLLNMNTGTERTVDIYLDPIVLRMETVASVKFVGKNITRSGVVSVESLPEVIPSPHRKVTYINKNASESSEKDKNQQHKRQSPLKKQTSSGLQTSETVVIMQRDIEFAPLQTIEIEAHSVNESTDETSLSAKQVEEELPSIDEILASKLRNNPTTPSSSSESKTYSAKKNGRNKNKNGNSGGNSTNKQKDQKQKNPQKKSLEKFKFDDDEDVQMRTLDQVGKLEKANGGQFDQFKGRASDFSMDIYSVKLPDHVTPELQARADRVEREITNQGKDEDQIINLVDSDCKMDVDGDRKEDIEQQSEEQLYGTAVLSGERADESIFDKSKIEAERQSSEQKAAPSTQNPSIKQLLFKSLGAGPTDSTEYKEDYSQNSIVPQAIDDADLMRSRNNSLRNGETSRVIENLDIEAPKMEQEQIEEYLRYKALKNSQQQSSGNGLAPRDRKLSQDYFKEEAKRLDKKLLQGKHLKSTVSPEAQVTTQAQVKLEEPVLAEPIQSEQTQRRRFTCFKPRNEINSSVPLAFGLYEKMPMDII